jgi:hypothetical protein
MKRLIAVLSVVALIGLVAGCNRASTPLSPTASAAVTAAQTQAKTTSYVFAKIPPQILDRTITAPAVDVQAFVFSLDTMGTKGDALAEVAFMINGSLVAGNLSNFRLVYYPQGLTKAGTIIASNDGSTWAPGPTPADFLRLRPAAFALPQNFRGVFALLVDVNPGAAPYFFWTRIQTANAVINGVEQLLVNPIEQVLPLQGDTIHVN